VGFYGPLKPLSGGSVVGAVGTFHGEEATIRVGLGHTPPLKEGSEPFYNLDGIG
jgi:hypothetical protein